jgi:hypothetical protein
MMATAFLGYQHSPKWFNNKSNDTNNNGNHLNYRVKLLFNKSLVKRDYCTSSFSNSTKISERLKTIRKELYLNPVYIYLLYICTLFLYK